MARLLLAVALVASVLTGEARAETRRLAVIVGNNAGVGTQPPLRFAEADAERMAQVLTELGGVAGGDLQLLKGRSAAEVRAALARVRASALAVGPGTQVVVLFFFSGHSDGVSIEVGPALVAFAEVREWLRETRAAVRLAILDSCRSGGLLAVKGGVLGPSFDVRLADSLASTGEVLITSSAASESALESAEIRASYFSHHLISGLRGAADVSGDGLVTLSEAYQYAFSRTVKATADTTIGPQHPAYEYRLTGQGDFVLTQIKGPSAVLELPPGFDRFLVLDGRRHEIVAEVGNTAARRLATRPGSYEVRAWRGGRLFAGKVDLVAGARQRMDETQLAPSSVGSPRAKGAELMLAGEARADLAARTWRALVGAGASLGATSSDVVLTVGRLGAASAAGWIAAVTGSTGRGETFRESHLGVRLGRHAVWGHKLRLVAGGELGGGVAFQHIDGGRVLWSTTASAVPVLGAAWDVLGDVSLSLTAEVPTTVLRRDQRIRVVLSPLAFLGVWF